MRKLLIALAALLIPAQAFAQQLTYSPGQQGAVGNITTATDTNGVSSRRVLPAYTPTDTSGNEKCTTASPCVQVGNVASGATDSGAPVKVGGVFNTTQPTLTTGQRGDVQLGSRGSIRVEVFGAGTATGAGVGLINGDSITTSTQGLAELSFGYVFNGATWDRWTKPNVTARLLSSAATTNATSVKAFPGNLQKIICNNTNAADRYLKIYNKASAPTVGTDVPILTLTLPASTKNIQIDLGALGQFLSTGIAYAITANAADADTTAVGAGDITALNMTYS